MSSVSNARLIVLRFADPLEKQHMNIVSNVIRKAVSEGLLPNCVEGYRAVDDGFGRIVNAKINGGSEL